MFKLVVVTKSGEKEWQAADVRQRVVVGSKVALLVPEASADHAECVDCLSLGTVSRLDGVVKGIEILMQEALDAAGYNKPAPKKAAPKKTAAPQHDWDSMTVSTLREYAKERSVSNYKKMKKADLIAALKG